MSASCAYHPEAPSASACILCGRAVCSDCLKETDSGSCCPACVALATVNVCFLCGDEEACILEFQRVLSAGFSFPRTMRLRTCRPCTTRLALSDFSLTLLFGWWGWPGLFLTPPALAKCLGHLRRWSTLPAPAWLLLALLPFGCVGAAGIWAAERFSQRGAPFDPLAMLSDSGGEAADAEQGLRLLEERRFAEAIPFLERAVRAQPAGAAAAYQLGCALRGAGRVVQSLPHLARAIERDPPQMDYRLAYAAALLEAEQFPEAIRTLDVLLSRLPLHMEANYLRALADYRAGRPADTVARLDPLRPEKPLAVSAPLLCGAAARDLGRTETACAAFERALAADPACFEAHQGWQEAMLDAGRLAEVRAKYEQSAAAHPDSALFAACFARLFHDGVKEIAGFQRAIHLDDRCLPAWIGMARARFDRGESAGALEASRRALLIDPVSAEGRRLQVASLLALRRIDEAEASVREYGGVRPDDVFVPVCGIEIAAATGDWARATRLLDEARRRLASRPASRRRLRGSEARVAAGTEDATAEETAWTGLSDDPASGPSTRAEARFARAALAWKRGDPAVAAAHFADLADAADLPPQVCARAALWCGVVQVEMAAPGDDAAVEGGRQRWRQAAAADDLPGEGDAVALPARWLLGDLPEAAFEEAMAHRRPAVRNDFAFLLGWKREREGNVEGAVAAYRRAFTEHPSDDFPARLARRALIRLGAADACAEEIPASPRRK